MKSGFFDILNFTCFPYLYTNSVRNRRWGHLKCPVAGQKGVFQSGFFMQISNLDINCDMGEGMRYDLQIMPMVSSCNIACGGHAGDTRTMEATVALALENQVKIGAHPSFPDRRNFGRTVIEIRGRKLKKSLRSQISALLEVLRDQGGKLHHIKAHGALYQTTASNRAMAELFLDIMEPYKPLAFLYVPYGSQLEILAESHGFRIKKEAFLDRNYLADLRLVPRNHPQAIITDPQLVGQRLIDLVHHRTVTAIDGARIPIKADTYCLHGDNPAILEILHYLTANFADK